MTPKQRLNRPIPNYLLLHELGHTAVGLSQSLPEGGIEFVENSSTEVARAHYNSTGVSNRDHARRAIAGICCQSLHASDSVESPLREQIIDATLFAIPDVLEDDATSARMEKHGFWGDWNAIRYYSGLETKEPQERLSFLKDAHKDVLGFLQSDLGSRLIEKLHVDILEWLETEDDDLQLSPGVFYSISRPRDIYRSLKAASGEIRGR